MLKKARTRVRRRFSRLDVRLGVRLALAAVAAMIAGRALGLSAFYWAGISAIIVSTGTPVGSFAASLARCGGTLLGLVMGLLAVALLGHTLPAAALAIFLAILACQALNLRPGLKVAALSTLFPVAAATDTHGLATSVTLILSRTENVVLGCAVTLLIDGLLWPQRVSTKLQALIRRDVARAGNIAGGILKAYIENRPSSSAALLPDLQRARLSYPELLQELGSEPDDPGAPESLLEHQAETVHLLADHCAGLRDIQRQAEQDQAPSLLRAEIDALSDAFRAASTAFSKRTPDLADRIGDLRAAGVCLEAAYDTVRGDKGTQDFPKQEVFRLLGVLYLCGALVRAMVSLEEGPGAEAEELVAEG